MFKDKTLLITGGTGSFGNAVLEKFLDSELKEIRIFSRDEKKQEDIRWQYNNPKIKYYIGDVRSLRSVDEAMKGVDFVFHAAALKQVPSCEFFPIEAVKTNVLGTENVLDSAIKNGARKVIVLSTDKACYPSSAMGMTKALAERVMLSKSRDIPTDISFCATRYGNVMASRGSVIPLFVKQIKEGKPLTITNPDMTRFMMTLDEAVDLVVYAYEHGTNGDTFVHKAPACTIQTLAEAILSVYGVSNPIRVIGTRHGEKLFETLLTAEEMTNSDDIGTYYRIRSDVRDLNYAKYFVEGNNSYPEEYTSHNTQRLNLEETKEMLLGLDFIKQDLGL